MPEPIDNHLPGGAPYQRNTSSTEFGALSFGAQGARFQVTKELLTSKNIDAALSVIKSCFSAQEDIDAARLTYERFIGGHHRFHSEFSGTEVELLSYNLYRVGDRPARRLSREEEHPLLYEAYNFNSQSAV